MQAILIVFYRYAVKYIPSNTIRIPLKVFSNIGPDGMIRLPTEDEAAVIGNTFDSTDEDIEQSRFHDEDDDIPPPVPSKNPVKMSENEEDFFDVSDDEEEEQVRPAGQDEGTKAWRD